VNNETKIAISLGMSETLVGVTIIAIGTSLPELVTSITDALKKESEISLGNIVGSTIFNILFVLVSSSIIASLHVNYIVFIDMIIMNVLTSVLFIISHSRYRIGKIECLILVFVYIFYLGYIILRN